MRLQLTPFVILACAATFACGGEKPAPAPAATAAAPAASAPAATMAPAATTAAGDSIGIPECDEYIRKYEACLRDKVPATSKAQMEQALRTYRSTWRAAAAQPAARASLATSCQQAIQSARLAMGAYGCQW